MSDDIEIKLQLVLYLHRPSRNRNRLDVEGALPYRKGAFRAQELVSELEVRCDGKRFGDSVQRQVSGYFGLILALAAFGGTDARALEDDLRVLGDLEHFISHRPLDLLPIACADLVGNLERAGLYCYLKRCRLD